MIWDYFVFTCFSCVSNLVFMLKELTRNFVKNALQLWFWNKMSKLIRFWFCSHCSLSQSICREEYGNTDKNRDFPSLVDCTSLKEKLKNDLFTDWPKISVSQFLPLLELCVLINIKLSLIKMH